MVRAEGWGCECTAEARLASAAQSSSMLVSALPPPTLVVLYAVCSRWACCRLAGQPFPLTCRYIISPEHRERFEYVIKTQLPELFKQCPEFLRHKACVL